MTGRPVITVLNNILALLMQSCSVECLCEFYAQYKESCCKYSKLSEPFIMMHL